MDNQELWNKLCIIVRAGEKDFSLESIKLVRVSKEELIISSPTSSTMMRVREKFLPLIAETWQELTGETVVAKVIKRDATRVASVVDDGHLMDPRLAEIRKKLRRGKKPSETSVPFPPLSSLQDQPKKEAPKTVEKRLPAKIKLDILTAAVKQFYQLGEIRFILPYPEEHLKRPRFMAINLARFYLGENHNSDIGKHFGVTGNSISTTLQKIARIKAKDPKFIKEEQAIKDSLLDNLGGAWEK